VFTFIVEDLSRKYMKLAKERVRDGDQTPLRVLRKMHHGLLRLVAPIAPVFTESTYQDYASRFKGEKSVFLEPYPEPDESAIDAGVESSVDLALEVVEALLAYRDEKGIGLRYPLRCVRVEGVPEEIVRKLANVKKIGRCSGDRLLAGKLKIVVDATQGDEELREGLMREASRRVRSLRGKKKLNLRDKVEIHVWGDDRVIKAVRELEGDFIRRIGASKLFYGRAGSLQEEWEFKGIKFGAGL